MKKQPHKHLTTGWYSVILKSGRNVLDLYDEKENSFKNIKKSEIDCIECFVCPYDRSTSLFEIFGWPNDYIKENNLLNKRLSVVINQRDRHIKERNEAYREIEKLKKEMEKLKNNRQNLGSRKNKNS